MLWGVLAGELDLAEEWRLVVSVARESLVLVSVMAGPAPVVVAAVGKHPPLMVGPVAAVTPCWPAVVPVRTWDMVVRVDGVV